MTALVEALGNFVNRYQGNKALVAEMRGWSCGICLETVDDLHCVCLGIEDGQVVTLGDASLPYALVIRSDLEVLLDVLEFRRDPNEPYLFGELTIQGAEDDFMRLDYMVTRLCER